MNIRRSLVGIGVIVGIIAACILVIVMLAWRIAHAPVSNPPSAASLPGLRGEARMTWAEAGDAQIDAPNRLAATASLGYVHGWNHASMMELLRRAASGRLAEWFGHKAIPADSLTRSLGLALMAEESFAGLARGDQDLLTAYAEGVSAAWTHSSIALRREFLVLDHAPEPWLPWHSLAVERLIGYLAAELDCTEAVAFCQADSTLRKIVHLHGFSGSLAWTVSHDSVATLYQRHVYGNSALPVFQEAMIRVRGLPSVFGATLVGTPYFVGGQSHRGSWAVLLGSTGRLTHGAWSPVPVRHERILDDKGDEHICSFFRADGRLLVAATSDTTAWVLSWPGLAIGSDIAAWRALPEGRDVPFRLSVGAQIRVDTLGRWRAMGHPAVRLESPQGILISRDTLAVYLSAPDSTWLETQKWVVDTRSAYAETVLPTLLAAVYEEQTTHSSRVDSALTYLENWDYRYSRSSIGASLYAEWMNAYLEEAGVRFSLTSVDAGLVVAALEKAVQVLSARFGPNQFEWRWGALHPDRRFFAAAHAPHGATLSRFAPLEWPGQGHGSAPRWGPSTSNSAELVPSATFELWHPARWHGKFAVRRRLHPETSFLLHRELLGHDEVPIYSLPSQAAYTTTLKR